MSTRIILLILLLFLHVDGMAVTGMLSKSFYVPVVKGEYAGQIGEMGNEPEAVEEPEKPEELEEQATPTNLFVIVSEPIQIEVDELETDEEIETEESPQLEEDIE